MTWQKTRIGEFLFERKGKYKPDDEAIAGLMRLNKIDFSGNFHVAQKPSKTNMIMVCPGDLVISGINVSKGAMGIYYGDTDITATIHYSSYTFDTSIIDVEYFKRFLKSAEFIKLLQDQVKGGIKTEIKPKHLLSLEIGLSPVAEQKEIVEYFKSIETEDGDLKSELANQQALLKKLRQQILQEAIEGKLTKEFRVTNCELRKKQEREITNCELRIKETTDVGEKEQLAEIIRNLQFEIRSYSEPASELLKRIKVEKEQLIKDKKIKKQKPLPLITEEDKPFDLPEGWEWVRLDNVIYESPRNGYSPKAVDFPTATKTLKLGATTTGKFIETKIKYINEKIPEESFLWLEKRNILVQRGNSMDFVGVSAIYNGENHKFIYPDLMMKLKPVEAISEVYLHHVLMSSYCREYYRDNATGAQKSMPKINQNIVSNTIIPLPPLPEQKAIVEKVEKLLEICDQLERKITGNQAYAEQLMQAVLKEAFSQ